MEEAVEVIGELAAPQAYGWGYDDGVPPPPLAEDRVAITNCDAAAEHGGEPLRHLADPPVEGARAYCLVDLGPGGAPRTQDDGLAEPWSVAVLYVPQGMHVERHSYEEILDAGGLEVALRFGAENVPITPEHDPHDVEGGHTTIDARGATVRIQRDSHRRVTAIWHESTRAHWSGRMQVFIRGNHTPDAVAGFVRELREGPVPEAQRALPRASG